MRVDPIPPGVEFDNARLGGDEQRQARRTEDRFLGSVESNQRVIGIDDQGLRPGIRRHQPADRDLQRPGGAVARVLDLEVAAIRTKAKKVMHPRADGLLLVRRGFGGDDQQANRLAIGGREHRHGRVHRKRDDVLERTHHRALVAEQAAAEVGGIQAARVAQIGDVQ